MQLTSVLITLSAATAALAAPSTSTVSCNDPKHPCNTYSKHKPVCGDAYVKDLKACVAAGACGIRWIQDPVAACQNQHVESRSPTPSCSDPKHPCNTYNTHHTCTSKWVSELNECQKLGACGVRWFQNPQNICNVKDNDCSNPNHPCNLYGLEEHCSEGWRTQITKCVKAGACGIRWFQDPLNECPKTQ